jgi:biopolymer transport protein ExbB/TolQ
VLTGCFYLIVTRPALRDTLAYRYFCGHPIEVWTTWLFCWGMAALGWKTWRLGAQRAALRQPLLPVPAGRPVSVTEVPKLLQALGTLPRRMRDTWLVRRLHDALGYVQQRGSATTLEKRLGVLADRDAEELEGSYDLVRNVTWAIPILGFLGTVVGITIAIANISPEQLQESLSDMVGGLAVAFDTTALALTLSMGMVLAKFLVERTERAVLARVDAATEEILLHRFEAQDAQTHLFLGVVEGVANAVMRATQEAWREQGQLWTRAVEQVGEAQVAALERAANEMIAQSGQVARQMAADQNYRFADIVKRLETLEQASSALLAGLREVGREWLAESRDEAHQRSVEQETQFARFLSALEAARQAWQDSLGEAAARLSVAQTDAARQTEMIAQLVLDGGRIEAMQKTLNLNLAALTNVQALDETIHSLAAAAHLLTGRAVRLAGGTRLALNPEPPTEAAA